MTNNRTTCATLWPALLLGAVIALGCADSAAAASGNPAASALLETAAADLQAGQLDQAAATLERALRIEPRNPAILHYLGQTRLQQGQYQQAEELAAKSNTLAGNDRALRERNARLIADARLGPEGRRPSAVDQERLALQQRLDEEIARRRQAEAQAASLQARLDEQTSQPATSSSRLQENRDVRDEQGYWQSELHEEPRKAVSKKESKRYAKHLPKGHRPPRGMCRIWFPGRPPGQQPAPGRCGELRHHVPPGAWLVRG